MSSTALELLPAEVTKASSELSVSTERAASLFTPFEAPYKVAAELLLKEISATEAPAARRLRLDMVKARSAIGSAKKSAKADILLAGNVIDWFHNKGIEQLEQAEARLEDIEKVAERAEAARKQALKDARMKGLSAFGVDGQHLHLDEMPEEAYQQLLETSSVAHTARLEAAKKIEADRLENLRLAEEARVRQIEEARVERERLAAENVRLRAEAEERERLAKIERDAAAEASRIAAETARVERLRVENLERIERERVEAETKRTQQIAEDEARAAAAPDREKLLAFAASLDGITLPVFSSKKGEKVAGIILQEHAKFVAAVRYAAKHLS